jgi:hypothetical protein
MDALIRAGDAHRLARTLHALLRAEEHVLALCELLVAPPLIRAFGLEAALKVGWRVLNRR